MNGRRWLTGIVASVSFVFGVGCGEIHPPRIGDPIPTSWESSEETAYQTVLRRYSARTEAFAGFDTRLFAAATIQTPAFREARLRRQAEFQREPRDWLERSLKAELAESALFYDVMVGVHIADNQFEDMSKATTVWRMALFTSAGEVNPVRVDRIGKGTQVLSAYYPWLDLFWVLYRVRFPRILPGGGELVSPGTEKVTLKLASPLARVEMSFPAQ